MYILELNTNFVILLLKQNGIIIQPNSITITTNEDIKTLIKNKIKQLDYEYELKKINSSKDKFFAIIGHDLRNPIANLIQSLEFITNDKNIDETLKSKILKELKKSSNLKSPPITSVPNFL